MSSSDSRQTRYANTNANARRPGNWGSDPARDYRPIGQRYGSVLVLSGPKRKQSGPTVRKPIPRPVNLPSQRKDRQAEGSLLSSKQTRTEDSVQSENTAQSLNSHTWHNSSGTWTSPQESTNRTDEYGFPIRSEAPINAREFPSLAASKQAPVGKKSSQQDQADAYFSLDDRDTLPLADGDTFKAFGARRDERADGHQDWRTGRGDSGQRDEEFEGRAFPSGRNSESRRGAFGFNSADTDRRGSSGATGFRSRSGGSNAFGGRGGARLEDYGMRPGTSPGADKGSPGPRPGDDYVGPAAQVLGESNTIISSTLLGSGITGLAAAAQGDDEEDEEEDEELQRHYKELEAIKKEEEEKTRQRVIAAEAGSVDGVAEECEDAGTWEDAAVGDDQYDQLKPGDDAMGLKPIDHEKWQQRQAELEEEDRLRRERAEAKKRELEEAITRREEMKQRAAIEASEAALAALAAANAPISLQQQPQIVPPPPPPPPRAQPPAGDIPEQPTADDGFQGFAAENPSRQEVPRRPELVPAPAPAQPAWTQSLYSREQPKPAVDVIVPPPPPPPRAESSQSTTKSTHQEGWTDEWRSDGGQSHGGRDAGHRVGGRDSRADGGIQGRGRGRRADGGPRAADVRGGRSRPSTSALTTPGSNTPQASSRGDGQHGDAGSTTASATASDADAAAVAAAAKVAKAMEGYALSLPSVLPSKGSGRDGGSKQAPNGIEELTSSASPPLSAPPSTQQDATLYSSYGGGAALMPASDAVHTLERMDKRTSMFDGKEDGEDLLPSNIFGGDDALYSGHTGKSASTGVVPSRPSPLLPLHDAGFGPPLPAAQGKSVAGSAHVSRAFSSPDHPSALPLGSPAAFGGPARPHQSVRDRLPDDVPLWGRSHDWAPPPPPTTLHHSSDLHLHTAPFHPGDVSTYMPSTAPTQQAPTSNPPPSFNAFGYPSSTYSGFGMQQQSYSLNAVFQQPPQPLLPTSKPPDWSNNAPAGLGWPSVTPPVAGHANSVHPVMSAENQPFGMRPPASHNSSFSPNTAGAQATSMPVAGVAHPHQRRVEVEMKLPDTLGLGSGPGVSKVPINAAATATSAPTPSGNSNSRGGRGSRGNRGANNSGPPPPPPRSGGGRGEGNQSRSRGADTERSGQGQNQSSGGGGSRRQGFRGGRGRGQGRRGRERAETGPAPSSNAV